MSEQQVYKLVFAQPDGSEKSILMRKMKIKDQSTATTLAATKVPSGNPFAIEVMMQEELMKMLIIEVDGQRLKGAEKEDLDSFLEPHEYFACLGVIKEVLQGNAQPTVEVIKGSGSE